MSGHHRRNTAAARLRPPAGADGASCAASPVEADGDLALWEEAAGATFSPTLEEKLVQVQVQVQVVVLTPSEEADGAAAPVVGAKWRATSAVEEEAAAKPPTTLHGLPR